MQNQVEPKLAHAKAIDMTKIDHRAKGLGCEFSGWEAIRTVLSALQASSAVMWTRRRVLASDLSACRLMPVLAASLMMATSLSPL